MPQQSTSPLNDTVIRAALRQAWHDSHPGMPERREEGGFILRDPTGNLSVARWPKGLQNSIILPAHANCKIGDQDIVASFHTHPNIEPEYLQEPSETDKRAVRNDPNLKGAFYEGEYVISQRTIYLINPVGQVSEVGNTEEVLSER